MAAWALRFCVTFLMLPLLWGTILWGVRPAAAAAERRVALVIGNAAYRHAAPLTTPVSDIADLAAVLRSVGFEVLEGHDLDKRAMEQLIRKFSDTLEGAAVGVFYYAGHGLQVQGQNYLVPVDAQLDTATSLDFEMVRLDLVQRTMERETALNLIFLDACRDNPMARNLARSLGTRSTAVGQGLAAVESGQGTLISFSTQPGNIAQDGKGRNSPYAAALIKHIATPGDDISATLINVRNEVMQATGRQQVPWEHSALTSRFYFVPPAPGAAPPSGPPLSGATGDQQIELMFWEQVRTSNDPALLQSYLDRYPSGAFSGLARILIDRAKKGPSPQVAAATPAPPPSRAPEPPAAAPTPSGPDEEALARNLQRELARVGCYSGSQDGNWGSGSRAALEQFAKHTHTALPAERPTPAALDAVSERKVRVCPLDCDDDEVERDGKCVARPRAKSRRAERRPPRRPEARRAEQAPGKKATRFCFGAKPSEIRVCD